MPGAMGSKVIRAEAVSAYSLCPRKAFLLQCTEERGTPHEYLGILEERAKVKRTEYLAVLDRTSTSIHSYNDCDISSGMDALTEAKLKATDVEAYCDVLTRVSSPRRGDPATYEPTIIVGTPTIQKDQILNLSFTGYVLGQLQNRPPAAGYLVTADGKL